jgi:glycosyltransferase involved in cell wall biosynthesis
MNWLSFARSLLSWNKSGTPVSIVIGSSPHLFAALAAQRLALRLRVPFVLEIRDLWPESMVAAGGTKGGFYWLLHFVAEHLYRKASRIVVLARGTEDYLRKKGIEASKIVLVPNGVELEAYSGIERRARDTFTLIYTGAHGQANGLDVIVKAADILRDVPHVRFLLVGDGPMKPKLQEDVLGRGLGNVEFRSPVSKSRMPDLLLEADAGLMVLKETQLFSFGVSPNKLFDYLAAGLPVVCNVPGEVSQMLLASTAGEQAQDGTPESLAEAIRRLANRSHEERASMGRAGRQWVAREHNRNVLAAKLDAALRPMLDRN